MPPVIEDDAQDTPVVPAGQDGKQTDKSESVTLSKAEVESLRRERDEARESERYWAGVARSTGRTQQAEPEAESEDVDGSEFLDDDAAGDLDGDTAEKLVDDLASKGVAGLKSRGFITAKEAQKLAADVAIKVSRELIGRERQKITSDTQIMSEFPELKDQNSELFKETAKRYQKAVAMDPNAKKTPAALYLAADGAREALKAKAPAKRREEDEGEEHETDRRRRADSQDGRTRSRGEVDDRDDMLGDEARQVIRQMGITEEEYKASVKTTGRTARRSR